MSAKENKGRAACAGYRTHLSLSISICILPALQYPARYTWLEFPTFDDPSRKHRSGKNEAC